MRPDSGFLWDICLKQVLPQAEIRQETRVCRSCGCVFRSPAWDEAELERIYSPETWRLVEPYRPKTPEALRNNEARRRSMVELILRERAPSPGGSPPAIADIGGRDGFYVAPFLDEGWSVVTIDPATGEVVDQRIKRLPLRLDQTGLHKAFDAVVLSHILEHLVTLKEFLGKVWAALRPEGVVYAEVPYEVHQVLLGRDLWDPSHQVYFATRTLRYLFESNGFAVRLCARQRATYDVSELLSIVVLARKPANGETLPQASPPGMLHALAEMVSPAVVALTLRQRRRRPSV